MKDFDEYEPNDEELKEIEDLLNKEEEDQDRPFTDTNDRILFEYKDESMWKGWLALHGIRW